MPSTDETTTTLGSYEVGAVSAASADEAVQRFRDHQLSKGGAITKILDAIRESPIEADEEQ
jgi:hypothetical protein